MALRELVPMTFTVVSRPASQLDRRYSRARTALEDDNEKLATYVSSLQATPNENTGRGTGACLPKVAFNWDIIQLSNPRPYLSLQ